MAHWMEIHPVWGGFLGGLFITFLNLVGALIVLFWPRPSQKVMDASLGFAAGVMLTASFTSLILPGIEYGGVVPVILGILLGAGLMDLADHLLPHEHAIRGKEGRDLRRIRGIWLFIIAITLHNFPEGLAVGVGFGSGHFREGLTLALAIGIQNIPEGLSVALSALSLGYGRAFYAAWTGIRSGAVEIPAAFLGAVAVHYMKPLLPYAMGFAAGAMIYVVSDEIVPETHRAGHERLATFGTIIGAVVMLYLDVVLG